MNDGEIFMGFEPNMMSIKGRAIMRVTLVMKRISRWWEILRALAHGSWAGRLAWAWRPTCTTHKSATAAEMGAQRLRCLSFLRKSWTGSKPTFPCPPTFDLEWCRNDGTRACTHRASPRFGHKCTRGRHGYSSYRTGGARTGHMHMTPRSTSGTRCRWVSSPQTSCTPRQPRGVCCASVLTSMGTKSCPSAIHSWSRGGRWPRGRRTASTPWLASMWTPTHALTRSSPSGATSPAPPLRYTTRTPTAGSSRGPSPARCHSLGALSATGCSTAWRRAPPTHSSRTTWSAGRGESCRCRAPRSCGTATSSSTQAVCSLWARFGSTKRSKAWRSGGCRKRRWLLPSGWSLRWCPIASSRSFSARARCSTLSNAWAPEASSTFTWRRRRVSLCAIWVGGPRAGVGFLVAPRAPTGPKSPFGASVSTHDYAHLYNIIIGRAYTTEKMATTPMGKSTENNQVCSSISMSLC